MNPVTMLVLAALCVAVIWLVIDHGRLRRLIEELRMPSAKPPSDLQERLQALEGRQVTELWLANGRHYLSPTILYSWQDGIAIQTSGGRLVAVPKHALALINPTLHPVQAGSEGGKVGPAPEKPASWRAFVGTFEGSLGYSTIASSELDKNRPELYAMTEDTLLLRPVGAQPNKPVLIVPLVTLCSVGDEQDPPR